MIGEQRRADVPRVTHTQAPFFAPDLPSPSPCGQICGFFFPWAAGKCVPKDPEWGESYGMRCGPA